MAAVEFPSHLRSILSSGLDHAVQPGVVETAFRLGLGHIFGAGGPPMITA
jgi:hypothetical protein